MSDKAAKILIVEDEKYISDVLQRALEKEGYAAQAVDNGEQALKLFASSSFDLILCDLELSGINGLVCYEKLVERQPSMAGRFIFMTGEMLDPTVQEFISTRRIPLLMKPFDLQEFLLLVETVLNAA